MSGRAISDSPLLAAAVLHAWTEADVVLVDDIDEAAEPAAALSALFAAAPGIRLLCTARAPLGMDGEVVVRVDPLPEPDPSVSPEELQANPAVRLFLEVAERIGGTARLDATAIRDVAWVCRELGCIPLAIELVAARSNVFSPATLREILGRSSPDRLLRPHGGQRSVLDAIGLSAALLKPEPRQLVMDLSVFSGPVPVSAIAAVIVDDNLLDDLSTLVDVHLVAPLHTDHESRLKLPRLVRSYALARSQEDPQRWADLIVRHTAWAVETATTALGLEREGRPTEALRIVDAVEADLLAALDRVIVAADGIRARRLCICLVPLWFNRGAIPADLDRVGQALAVSHDEDGSTDDIVILSAWQALLRVELSSSADDVAAAVPQLIQVTDRARELGGAVHVRVLLLAVLAARVMAQRDAIMGLCAEGLTAARAIGDQAALVRFEAWTGMLAHQAGQTDEAARWGQSAFERACRLDDMSLMISPAGLLRSLPPGSDIPRRSGGSPFTRNAEVPNIGRLIQIAHTARDRRSLAWLLPVSAALALEADDHRTCADSSRQALRQARVVQAWPRCIVPLMWLALVAFERGDVTRGGRLAGATSLYRDVVLPSIPPWMAETYERRMARIADSAGAALEAGLAHGVLMTLPEAVDDAIGYADYVTHMLRHAAGPVTPPQELQRGSPLTEREEEILTLLCTDATNAQIAQTLCISAKTVMHHTSNIYRKLAVRGRAQAVAWHLRSRDVRDA